MEPFDLITERLILNQPHVEDIDDIAYYCADTAFEKYMATPWPYEREHAAEFVTGYVPDGWQSNKEWTWAIRERSAQVDNHNRAPLLGVVGVRLQTGMVGFWLGAKHRGRSYTAEALRTVVEAVFERTELETVKWECFVGNIASARVAEKVGFRYTGEALGTIPARDGSLKPSWTGEIDRNEPHVEKPGWLVTR